MQYAYARICNILNRAIELNYDTKNPELSLLNTDIELEIINNLISFPDCIKEVANKLEPQIIINYLQNIALQFHRFYSKNKVLTDDKELSKSRLLLIKSIKIVLRNGLDIIGISHPERM